MKRRKNKRLDAFLDSESAELLERIAEKFAEGNRSQAVRKAIKVAAQMLLEQKVDSEGD